MSKIDKRILAHKNDIRITVLKYAENEPDVDDLMHIAFDFLSEYINKYQVHKSSLKTFISVYTEYAMLTYLGELSGKTKMRNDEVIITPMEDYMGASLVDDSNERRTRKSEIKEGIDAFLEILSSNSDYYYLVTRSFGVGGHTRLSPFQIKEETGLDFRHQKRELEKIFKQLRNNPEIKLLR